MHVSSKEQADTLSSSPAPMDQAKLSPQLSETLLLHAQGMTFPEIRKFVYQSTRGELSDRKIQLIISQAVEYTEQWEERKLEETYPIVYLDKLPLLVRLNNDGDEFVDRSVIISSGITLNGTQTPLGLWTTACDSEDIFDAVLNELRQRGLSHIGLVCSQDLAPIQPSLERTYPDSGAQLCFDSKVRQTLDAVAPRDRVGIAKDISLIYSAVNRQEALELFSRLQEKWNQRYPLLVHSWQRNWESLSTCFTFPKELRTLAATTVAVQPLYERLRSSYLDHIIVTNVNSFRALLILHELYESEAETALSRTALGSVL